MRKGTLNKLIRDETGQALVIVLILILLGGLIIPPLLSHVGTGIWVGKEVYEERMYGQYAADAGVEDALYKIKVDAPALPDEWNGVWTGDEYDIPFTYSTPQLINGNNVEVTIQPYWVLTGLEDDKNGMMPHAEMVVVGDTVGTVDGNGLYQISINYDQSKGELFIERIGAWLPAGYSYVDGSSNLEQAAPGAKCHCVPVEEDYRGGKAITWNYSSPYPKFEDFPGSGNKRIVTFQFTPSQGSASAFSWARLKRGDVYLSWDAGMKIYQITSKATDTVSSKSVTVEAYATKNETPGMGSAISGDYVAIGGTLMTPNPNDSQYAQTFFRGQLLMGSNATVASGTGAGQIPANATVEGAYLYWSGWIDYHYAYYNTVKKKWEWKELSELKYPSNPTPQKLTDLVETAAKVNRVELLFGNGSPVTITVPAPDWQVMENTGNPGTWSYSCYYNATDLVKQLINDGKLDSNGSGIYTVKHVPEDRPGYSGESPNYSFELYDTGQKTGYPLGTPATKLPSGESSYQDRYEWAYAGWSLIIIYSSPQTKGHQLYLYDDFRYVPVGTTLEVPISGFLAPAEIKDEDYAAKLTCFVGDGDACYSGDYIQVTGQSGTSTKLWDGIALSAPTPPYTGPYDPRLPNNAGSPNNVWNSQSVVLGSASGIDIDTFTVGSPTINPGDTSAKVMFGYAGSDTRGAELFNIVYIILSFRSEIKTSGAISYIYLGGG